MFEIGGLEILVIIVVALIVLGPEKLPHAAAGAGRLAGRLRRAWTGFQRQLFLETSLEEMEKKHSRSSPSENEGKQ